MIARKLSSSLTWQGKKFKLNLAYDNVLRVMELQRDKVLMDEDKLELSLAMLVKNVPKIPVNKKAELFVQITTDFIDTPGKQSVDQVQTVDFTQDARYIYSSFWQAYGIDLQRYIGKLDWRKFVALFQGMPEDTKIREIMAIRARKIPVASKYNAEEIQALRESKAYYALDMSYEDTEAKFATALDRLAAGLEQRARQVK